MAKLMSSRVRVSSEESSNEDSSGSEPEAPPPPRPVEKKKPPLFMVVPDYVPKVPERVSSHVQLAPLGKVSSVVDGCVIIQAESCAPVMDTGSALFLEGGEPLGEIYETFGPVSTPRYIVVLPNSPCLVNATRGKSKGKPNRRRGPLAEVVVIDSDPEPDNQTADLSQQLPTELAPASTATETLNPEPEQGSSSKPQLQGSQLFSVDNATPSSTENISTDMSTDIVCPTVSVADTVYYVKDNPELSIPVFYSQLVQMKGSDASWVGDMEPPPEELEFSDDEQERLHKRNLRAKRRIPTSETTNTKDTPTSLPQASGNRMSQRNRHTQATPKRFPTASNSPMLAKTSNSVTTRNDCSPVFQPFSAHSPPFVPPLPSQPFFSPSSVSCNRPPCLPIFSQPLTGPGPHTCSPHYYSRPAGNYVQTAPRPLMEWPRFTPDSTCITQTSQLARDWPSNVYRNPMMGSPPLWFRQVSAEHPMMHPTQCTQSMAQLIPSVPGNWTSPPPAVPFQCITSDSFNFPACPGAQPMVQNQIPFTARSHPCARPGMTAPNNGFYPVRY